MIGFVYAGRPKNAGRENLHDIVIESKLPKPVSDSSWWTLQPPSGFTQFASALFERRCPTSSNVEQHARRKTDVPRDSEWDGQ